MTVTIRDIAEKTGFSTATVSRALSNYGYVSEEKRRIITDCAEKMQYTPNMIAKSMVKRQTKTIGIVIADIKDPFYLDIIEKIEALANAINYSVLLCNSNESASKENKNIRMMLERMADGVIIVPVAETLEESGKSRPFDDLVRNKVPFVFIDRTNSHVQTDVVMLDNYNTSFRSMGMLIERGYKNICIVYDPYTMAADRTEGVIASCRAKGYEIPSENWVCCDREAEHVYIKVRDHLLHHSCDALFALENRMTIGSLRAINELKLEINKDIYVLGFDDVKLYNQLIPQGIGVIQQPVEMLCKYAMEMLRERMDGRKTPSRTLRLEGEIRL